MPAPPIRTATSPATGPAPVYRPALYADHLLEEPIADTAPAPRFANLHWVAWQLVRLLIVTIAVGAPIAVLWRRH